MRVCALKEERGVHSFLDCDVVDNWVQVRYSLPFRHQARVRWNRTEEAKRGNEEAEEEYVVAEQSHCVRNSCSGSSGVRKRQKRKKLVL